MLEIGTEDLPARFIPPAMQQLKENTGRILREHHLTFSEIRTYGTPRRLAVIADGIPLMQEDRSKEVFGPSRKVAFDADGNPTKAATGFAQSQGIPVEKLTIKNKDKGEYVVAAGRGKRCQREGDPAGYSQENCVFPLSAEIDEMGKRYDKVCTADTMAAVALQ